MSWEMESMDKFCGKSVMFWFALRKVAAKAGIYIDDSSEEKALEEITKIFFGNEYVKQLRLKQISDELSILESERTELLGRKHPWQRKRPEPIP